MGMTPVPIAMPISRMTFSDVVRPSVQSALSGTIRRYRRPLPNRVAC
jgi:hypothetical protein